jgi:hypothetical protein
MAHFHWESNSTTRWLCSIRVAFGSMRTLAKPVLLISVTFAFCGQTAARAGIIRESDPIVDRIAKVDLFAFGGIGFTGVISQGEKDYRSILSRASAEADFERIFAVGSPEAKCYALVALRKLNSQRFTALISRLRSSKRAVATAHGCNMMNERLAALSERIRAGDYSH